MPDLFKTTSAVILTQKYFLFPFFALMLVSLLDQFTALGIAFENQFYIVASHSWMGANSWWANTLIHEWGRDLIAVIFLAALLLFAASFFVPDKLIKYRNVMGYLCLCIVLSTSIVALGKRYSNVDCPRDIIQYGGNLPYVHLFSAKPTDLPAGQCFPGGHSSGAFSLYALYFISLIFFPRHARLILSAVTLLGIAYGFGQWARGSHFLIHDVWSAGIGWYVSLTLFYGMFRQQLMLIDNK